MNWREALNSRRRPQVVEAFQTEKDSLTDTILTQLKPTDANWDRARREATPGRWLLDIKRSGKMKVRGVKQGFRENKQAVDGTNFNYHSHVVKFTSARMLLSYRRVGHVLCLIDISTAFLQSDPYPNGQVKFISFKNPFTNETEYFEQSGPIYGEA